MTRSRMVRVHEDFSDVIDMISKEDKKSKVECSRMMAKLFKTGRVGKKGNIFDIVAICFFALVFGVVILFGGFISHEVNNQVQAMNDSVATPEAKAVVSGMDSKFGSLWDGIFMFVLFGMIISSLIGAFMVDSHPIFMAITLIVSLFLLIMGVVVNNVYAGVASNPIMYSYAQNFPMMNAIFDNFLVVIIGYIVLLMIAMYAGKRGEATA